MKLRNILYLGTILIVVSCRGEPGRDTTLENPNILFIAVDDLRPELGCYGVEKIRSPRIDQLADGGTRFERAYCNIPVCGASRASLMTGLRPSRSRFITYHTWANKDAPGIVTLPEHFRNHGYHTISNGKVFHNQGDAPQSWSENWRPRPTTRTVRDYQIPENDLVDTIGVHGGPPVECAMVHDTAYKDGKVAEKTIRDLRKLAAEDRPFFLAAGFVKPHLPFNAPKKYWDLYDGQMKLPENDDPPENAPWVSLHNWTELRDYKGIPKEVPLTDSQAMKLIHGYYACVSYIDAQVGKILDELERLELDRNTIVILWGDHGYNLREHGLWCKHCNYETSLHVPLILKVPGSVQISSTPEIVEYVDIYPSLCELAGLELPDHLQGESFRDLLFDESARSDGVAVSQWDEAGNWVIELRCENCIGITTIKDHYFYTEWVDGDDSAIARMLYDHQADPHETVNIADDPEYASIVEEMSREMRRSRVEDYFGQGH